MSGVMTKIAVYGFIRIVFDLIGDPVWWTSLIVLAFASITAVVGILSALLQSDLKRLLAYSTVENVGIIFIGLGLALAFRANGMGLPAALALTAALFHVLNHSIFKSLLFFGAGAVSTATGARDMEQLGGLVHRMPRTSAAFLVGCAAIAALPPLNGFVSEWLLLQAYLFTPLLPHAIVNMLAPLGAAAFALTVALSAYVMVKFYGVIFLGRPRDPNLAHALDAGPRERAALALLAVGCVLLGIFPVNVIGAIDHVNGLLLAINVAAAGQSNWLLLAPIATGRSSYSPLIVLAVIVAVVLITIEVVHRVWHGRVRRASAWDCGFPLQTARMQDTAEGFGQPIRQVFEPFFRMERHLPSPFDERPRYEVRVSDPLWDWLYLPIARAVETIARVAGRIQHGRIGAYLTVSFATLLALLFFVR
jgi:formate hydrogenlyase subunit 3/multisubunit Na+/H+ antiporter MnhD subunit